jgi:hypothetical protein
MLERHTGRGGDGDDDDDRGAQRVEVCECAGEHGTDGETDVAS